MQPLLSHPTPGKTRTSHHIHLGVWKWTVFVRDRYRHPCLRNKNPKHNPGENRTPGGCFDLSAQAFLSPPPTKNRAKQSDPQPQGVHTTQIRSTILRISVFSFPLLQRKKNPHRTLWQAWQRKSTTRRCSVAISMKLRSGSKLNGDGGWPWVASRRSAPALVPAARKQGQKRRRERGIRRKQAEGGRFFLSVRGSRTAPHRTAPYAFSNRFQCVSTPPLRQRQHAANSCCDLQVSCKATRCCAPV